MAFYQKYRSKTFSELVGQSHVANTLLESIKGGRMVHAYLLTGPRGIGKTSTARLLAKAINCLKLDEERKKKADVSGEPCNECDRCLEIADGKSLDVIEIDAASHTGVDDVRDLIEKARLSPTKSFKKIYIIDEVHMLSKSAFNALLKTLEEPPSHVVFILATTEVQKIPATIISRVQRFDFHRAAKEDIILNLRKVCKSESIKIDSQSLDLIAVAAAGGHRDALGLLEQVSMAGGEIDIEATRRILGIPEDRETLSFVGAIFNNNPEEGLKIARRLYDSGHDLAEFNRKIIETLRKVMLCRVAGDEIIEDLSENKIKIKDLSLKTDLSRLMKIITLFMDASQLFKDVHYSMLPLEIAVVKAVNIKEDRAESPLRQIENKPVTVADNKPGKSSEEPVIKKDIPAEIPAREATVPVPVVDMTKDIWYQIVEHVKKENSTLAALLRDAKPEQLTNDAMTLGVKFKFHRDRISEPKNCQALEEVVSKVLGFSCKVSCKISNKQPVHREKNKKVDLAKAVSEVFEISETAKDS